MKASRWPVSRRFLIFLLYFHKYKPAKLLKTRTSAEQEFRKFKLRLETKKDKLWLASDPSKWELASSSLKAKQPSELLQNKAEAYRQMCHKENLMEGDLKRLFGYYSAQVMKEVPKGLELIAYNYRKLLEGMTAETEANFQEMLRDWAANRDFLLQDAVGRPNLIKGSSMVMRMERNNNSGSGADIDTVTERRESDSD